MEQMSAGRMAIQMLLADRHGRRQEAALRLVVTEMAAVV